MSIISIGFETNKASLFAILQNKARTSNSISGRGTPQNPNSFACSQAKSDTQRVIGTQRFLFWIFIIQYRCSCCVKYCVWHIGRRMSCTSNCMENLALISLIFPYIFKIFPSHWLKSKQTHCARVGCDAALSWAHRTLRECISGRGYAGLDRAPYSSFELLKLVRRGNDLRIQK